MVEFTKKLLKDIGLQREVEEALPYAVVGGAYEASFEAAMTGDDYRTWLNHVVPAGLQLKVLFLRVWTQESSGARFSIYQTNFGAVRGTAGTMNTVTGVFSGGVAASSTVEPYPQVGSVPSGVRDYPMLEAAGAEVLTGSLVNPVHVLEGSIEFRVLAQYPGDEVPGDATDARYGISWWGVQKNPE